MDLPVKWLLLVLIPTVAHARRYCYEQDDVVGYHRCRTFGSGWTDHGAAMAWEFGFGWLRFDPGTIDFTRMTPSAIYHVTTAPGDTRPITAEGFRFRDVIGFPHGFYVGAAALIAPFVTGPRLVADVAARGTDTTMPSGSSGFAMQNTLAFGELQRLGPRAAAIELAPGARITTFSTTDLPESVRVAADFRFVVIATARVETWIRPWLSLDAEAGANLLNHRDVLVGLSLGLHAVPFDGTR